MCIFMLECLIDILIYFVLVLLKWNVLEVTHNLEYCRMPIQHIDPFDLMVLLTFVFFILDLKI